MVVRQDLVTRDRARLHKLGTQPSIDASIVPSSGSDLLPDRIDKSVLTIAEPKRLRDKAHLRFVASQPCLICGRQPSDPHHLRFAQPRAIGLKVSDEFAVPLCRGHHRQLHQAGNEVGLVGGISISTRSRSQGPLGEEPHGDISSSCSSISTASDHGFTRRNATKNLMNPIDEHTKWRTSTLPVATSLDPGRFEPDAQLRY